MKTFITLFSALILMGKSYCQWGDGTIPNTPNPAVESFFDYNKTLGAGYGIRIGMLPRTCRLMFTVGVRFRNYSDSSVNFSEHSPTVAIDNMEKAMFQTAIGYTVAQHVLHIADLCPYAGVDFGGKMTDGFFGMRVIRELNHPHLIFSGYTEETIADVCDQPLRLVTGLSVAYYFGY